jgi:hypothetical protein
MKPALLTGAALLMAVSSVAFAQSPQVPAVPNQAGATSNSPGTARTGATNNAGKTGTTNSAANALNSTDNARAGLMADGGGMFTKVPARWQLSSKLVGLSVHNNENTDLGTIKDIAFDANGVKAYIVATGGFLGMGDHYVAVRPSAIAITYDATDDKWQASMNTDTDEFKAAPAFQYSSNG